ncbi:MAG: hypothetical protein N2Z23_00960 [Pyrinomonadaceae bacterium]|nr:hypothetical protein [Pyrinomonadaceae bacterium]MCX7639003.1 hypothetical protein [Pyrinomonadaceae bacterium]MDW8303777.1 hypothetical protein [Acidobacteriota bacterium]
MRRVFLLTLILTSALLRTEGQKAVDWIVATVRYSPVEPAEIITYSDLLWQIALSPDRPLNPPKQEDLREALSLLIEQKLFLLEAKRIPQNTPSDEEVRAEIGRIISRFQSVFEFEKRIRSVGFSSINDDYFRKILEERIQIEKYIDFRFRSFVIVTEEEEKKYYQETFVPNFRRRNPNLLVPAFEKVKQDINLSLTEMKVEQSIDRFLQEAKQRAEIEIFVEP